MTDPLDATPIRVQRRRTKGWRMPPNTVYVGRPTKWGNPYRLTAYKFADADGQPAPYDKRAAVEMAVRDYEMALHTGVLNVSVSDVRGHLRGKNLACFCPLDQPCHADVLLELAND